MATEGGSRPHLHGCDPAMRLDLPLVVTSLRDTLGPSLVALIAGATQTRAVHEWADGSRRVTDEVTERRLRLAYHLAALISRKDEASVTRAWFTGLNPELDEMSPARVLRDGDPDEFGPLLVDAARSFAAHGG